MQSIWIFKSKSRGKRSQKSSGKYTELECGETMAFENCHILLRTFNVHFLPRSVLFHQGFRT